MQVSWDHVVGAVIIAVLGGVSWLLRQAYLKTRGKAGADIEKSGAETAKSWADAGKATADAAKSMVETALLQLQLEGKRAAKKQPGASEPQGGIPASMDLEFAASMAGVMCAGYAVSMFGARGSQAEGSDAKHAYLNYRLMFGLMWIALQREGWRGDDEERFADIGRMAFGVSHSDVEVLTAALDAAPTGDISHIREEW